MHWFYIFAIIICTLSILYIAASYVIFRETTRRKRDNRKTLHEIFPPPRLSLAGEDRLREDLEWFDSNAKDEVTVFSHDGLKLFARVVYADKNVTPKGAIILFHGYLSSARRDFCMQMKILHDAGYHLLVPDQRAHGKSEGKNICYGLKERHDVICWRRKATELFGDNTPICLMGLSMGGATVLMASDLVDKNDTAVRCIVANCPFSCPYDIISYVLQKRKRIPAKPFMPLLSFWFSFLLKVDLRSHSAAASVAASHLPVLIFHGAEDRYVPIRFSEEVANASENVRRILIPNAKHASSIYHDEKLYTAEMLSFLEKYMQ